MEYWCSQCEEKFEGQGERCPRCLRKSTVVSVDQLGPGATSHRQEAAPRERSLWQGPGILVALAIIVPLMTLNFLSWRLPWFFTFIIAIIGYGAGHAANLIWRNRAS